jgi:putative SOS response-associated peptidase YedK
LVPHWAKDLAAGNRMINARAETLAARPAFRTVLERRRCLIPADGFYEWKREGARQRAPFYIHGRDGEPLAFAGLWDLWRPPQGDPVASCTIITTEPNELLAELHDRMPVILAPQAYDAWLSPKPAHADALMPWLVPCPPEWLAVHPVSALVNSPANEDPACIAPL